MRFLREKNGSDQKVPNISPAGSILVWVIRGIFLVVMLGLSIAAFQYFEKNGPQEKGVAFAQGVMALLAIQGLAVVILLTDMLIRRKEITTISAVYFGLLLGLLLGNLLAVGLDPFLFDVPQGEAGGDSFAVPRRGLAVMLSVVACYICVSTLLQTKDNFRFIIPFIEFSKQTRGNRPLVLDTSVIIDGRIADVCETSLIDSRIVVPRFVLQELQMVADSGDRLKRNRGRRGLDVLKRLRSNNRLEIQLHDGSIPGVPEGGKVDERLVLFAKAIGGRVVTNDFNLNKIAQLEGVDVVNLNEVANSLKSVALPGEILQIKVVKQGDQPGQGIGYLDDGTMVVVEQGRSVMGQDAAVQVTSVLQNPAGRMIFAKLEAQARG